jgi:hypothetical protein
MTLTTIGDWGFGSMVGLLALAAAALTCVLAPLAFRPSRDRLAAAIVTQLRRTRMRRTGARTPGRHQAGTVAPVAVPVIPGYDAAQQAALTAHAATLLVDTVTDMPVIVADTVTDLPAFPSGHYEPGAGEVALAAEWFELVRVQRRDGTGPHAFGMVRPYLPASTLPAPRHAVTAPRAMADDGRD